MILYGIFMFELFTYEVINSTNVVKTWTRGVIILQGILIPFSLKICDILLLLDTKQTYGDGLDPSILMFLPYYVICR